MKKKKPKQTNASAHSTYKQYKIRIVSLVFRMAQVKSGMIVSWALLYCER